MMNMNNGLHPRILAILQIHRISKNDDKDPWVCYIIVHEATGCTYVGVSPYPVQRLRRHNGEISGGAKYTTSKGPGWRHVCLIKGFMTSQQALQFEWAVKHVKPRKGPGASGLQNRLTKLFKLFHQKQWTSNAPPAHTVPLTLEWHLVNSVTEPYQKLNRLPKYITTQQYHS